MEKGIKSAGPRIKSFGRVVSVAFQQARQSEFDILSKRSIRERYASGDDYLAHPGDTGSHDEMPTTQADSGLRTIWRCCSEANRQAMQSEVDVLARRRFREFREADGTEGNRPAPGGDARDPGEARTPQEGNRNRSLPDSGSREGSLPECS
jgi:hypothetical protein